MKKTKTIIGLLCLVGTYFTAHYASTTSLDGMVMWGLCMTVFLFIGALLLIVIDNY